VDRVTLWRWERADGLIPEPWAYKALYLTRKPRRTAHKPAGDTIA